MIVRSPWTFLSALGSILYLWLMANVPLVAIPEAMHDDALFVKIAANIVSGRWLGEYNNLTLSKGPFYPIWIGISWLSGLPILVSQAALYAASCFLLVRALRPWLSSERICFVLYIVLLFNPVTYTVGQLRVMREGIYMPMTILLLALAVWWIRWQRADWQRRLFLAGAMGTVLAAYWCTREEGVWLLPTLLACLAVSIGTARATQGWRSAITREGLLAGGAAATAVFLVMLVAAMNYLRYGVFDVVEFKQKEFVSAYGALSRIKHETWTPYVVVPRAVVTKAAKVSPAVAELQPYLLSEGLDGFRAVGCSTYGVVPCDGEIRAGWFMWALREAAAQAGHYKSARLAKRFYGRLAQEINNACSRHELDCLPERHTLVPPFRWGYMTDTLATTAKMALFVATFQTADVPRDPMSCVLDDCGQIRRYTFFLDIVRTSLFVRPPWLSNDDFVRRSTEVIAPYQIRSVLVAKLAGALVSLYRLVIPVLLAISILSYGAMIAVAIRKRRPTPLLVVSTIAALMIATRLVLLAFLDATAIPSQNSLYLSPAYPAMVIFAILPIISITNLFRGRQPAETGSQA